MLPIVVVCEAAADQRSACCLADRVCSENLSLDQPAVLDSLRTWCGLLPNRSFIAWKAVRTEARARNIRIHGHFGDQPGEPDAHATRVALLLIKQTIGPKAVVLIRDSDGDERRALGLNQARNNYTWPFEVVVGLPHPMRECWLLAACSPCNTHEQLRLEQLRQQLGFNPVEKSHELTAREAVAKKNAKRVLRELLGEAHEPAEARLGTIPLNDLRNRGQDHGLSAYLQEIQERLVPLLQRGAEKPAS